MINIQWTKFERKSIVRFISEELPWTKNLVELTRCKHHVSVKTFISDNTKASDEKVNCKNMAIAGFHTSGAWVESVYYGINNTRPIYSERVHRALQNP